MSGVTHIVHHPKGYELHEFRGTDFDLVKKAAHELADKERDRFFRFSSNRKPGPNSIRYIMRVVLTKQGDTEYE